jgi:ATP-dependent DNA helicase RecG
MDLLLYFPEFYIPFNQPAQKIIPDSSALYWLTFHSYALRYPFKKRRPLLQVNARFNEQPINLIFFNQPYLTNFFSREKKGFVFGKVDYYKNNFQIINPHLFPEHCANSIYAVYPAIGSIKSGFIQKTMQKIFPALIAPPEIFPIEIMQKYGFWEMISALKIIHCPTQSSFAAIEESKDRFYYQEFFEFQCELQFMRNHFHQKTRKFSYQINESIKTAIKEKLVFELTMDQKKTMRQIVQDLHSNHLMQRLIQGDVGSGKTIVALIAMFIALKQGYQSAFLAPTEVLAEQHSKTAQEFFAPDQVAVLTSSTANSEKKRILENLKNGTLKIIIGTHALLEDTVVFHNLAMIVIDEQHRFGVAQRAAFYYKGRQLDMLVMTATPIPRTLLLSMYQDISVSLINTKPAGRKPIISKIIPLPNRHDFYQQLNQQLSPDNKIYIILPLIEPSDFFVELKAIKTETEYYYHVFKGKSIDFLHGKMSLEQKEAALEKFKNGKSRILISTTVIEVGVDVKDATIMIIEDADRFGLAQLHQLRGRVGRGTAESFCYLIPSANITPIGWQRLKVIESTQDGFKIAEEDLRIRGGGTITSHSQTGRLDFKIADPIKHYFFFKAAGEDIKKIIQEQSPQTPYIADLLNRFAGRLSDINFS